MGSLPLKPDHLKILVQDSDIAEDVLAESGCWSSSDAAEQHRLGYTKGQVGDGVIFPVTSVDGIVVNHQLRRDKPRIVNGKPVRYETIPNSRLAIYVHPRDYPILGEPGVPIVITEGPRKVLSGVSHGLHTLGLMGVWGWRGTNSAGGKTELPDWSAIALNGRDIIIAFDSDVMTKESVRAALDGLAAFLKRKGANVRYAVLGEVARG